MSEESLFPASFKAVLFAEGVPIPEREVRFHETRKWRYDYAWVPQKVALEVDGAIWKRGGGRHNRGAGMIKDMEKMNHAACLGWRVLRCTPEQLATTATARMIGVALGL